MSLRILTPVVLCLAATVAALADDAASPPLAAGIDETAMDKAVRPQDDLFRYVNGTWLANTPFPAEYASAGIGIMLFEKAQADVQAILLEAAAAGDKATPEMQRLGAMYASFMDEAKVESRGIEALKPLFAEIAAIDGPVALATLVRPRAGARHQHAARRVRLSRRAQLDAQRRVRGPGRPRHAESGLLPQDRGHLRRIPPQVRRLPGEAPDARRRGGRRRARREDPRARDEARD